MKIGIVLAKTPGYSETFFISKIRGLQDNGMEVSLFVQKKVSNFTLCKVEVAPQVFKRNFLFQIITAFVVFIKLIRFPRRLFKFIKFEIAVKRSTPQLIKNIYNNAHILTADLDWLHFGFTTLALQSEHVAKVIGAKMAVSFRGFDIDVFPLQEKDVYKLVWQRVDRIHTLSKYLLDKACKLGLSKGVSYQIIPPAIDVKRFVKREKKYDESIQLITVARLHWIKGLSNTLEALALLKSKGIAFNYQIIGQGHEFESLKYAIHQLQLQNYVKLIGSKSQSEIIDYLSNADIYIQYSHSEGFCNAVLEARAMGLLCVVSDGGGLKENIIDGQTGWVVPKRSPKLLAKRLEEVIYFSNKQKKQVADKSMKRIKDDFNLEEQMSAFKQFYEKVVS